MKLKKILFLGIVIVSALLIFYSRVPTLEKELFWYQSKGFSIYSQKYRDLVDEVSLNRTLSENKVSRISLRYYVPLNNGIVYYDNELELLYCVDMPESSVWVYMYITEIEKWSIYWHKSSDPQRSSYIMGEGS